MFWHKFSEYERFFPNLSLKVTIILFWSGLFVVKQFFVNITIANYFINNQDTFFVEHKKIVVSAETSMGKNVIYFKSKDVNICIEMYITIKTLKLCILDEVDNKDQFLNIK